MAGMRIVRVPRAVLVGVLLALAVPAAAECPPAGHDADSLAALKQQQFAIADDAQRQALALALVACLAHVNPQWRDGIAFEGLSTWMRGGQLDEPTRRSLLQKLTPMLTTADADGFAAPFAALVLSEVARTDRLQAWLSDGERASLVGAAADFLAAVRDYRGFDNDQGWRHGVAHGADLVMQLVLNPKVDAGAVERLLQAVAVQVAPAGEHSYVFGEPERLARPVLMAALRGERTPEQWRNWLNEAAQAGDAAGWSQAFASRNGLARRHNVRGFLVILLAESGNSDRPELQALTPVIKEVFAKLP